MCTASLWTVVTIVLASLVAAEESEDYVWMTDPQTHERYSVLKSSYDKDKAFVVGASTLSNRFSPIYLDNLADQCSAQIGPPGLFDFLNHTLIAVAEFTLQPDIYPYSFEIYARLFETMRLRSFVEVGLIAIFYTIVRHFFTKFFLETQFGRRFKTDDSQRKVMTPLWNLISYVFLFSVETAILLGSGYNDFVKPLCIFKNIHFKPGYFDEPLAREYHWLYMFQIGFYVHSFYATLRLDVKRKDTFVVLVHHLLTIALLFFSFFARFHRVGILVLFIHDISDIFLELSKLFIALRSKSPEHDSLFELAANSSFGAFIISWFYLRLYVFPTKVIYGTTWGVYLTHLDREAYFFLILNAMLAVLLVLHIYWSYFIVVMVYKMLLGKMPKLQDERDFESDSPMANGTHMAVAKSMYKHQKRC